MRTKKALVSVFVSASMLVAVSLAVGACSAGGDDEAAAEAPAALTSEEAAGGFEGVIEAVEAAPPAEMPAAEEPAAEPPALTEALVEDKIGDLGAIPVSQSTPGVPTRVIQNASLSVTVAKGDFETAVDRARQIAASLSGFVTGSTASQGGDERLVRGTMVLRVPQDRYASAMSQLTKLGTVVGRQESGTDVSLQYIDLESRARHLQAVETQLLGFLNETKTVADALVIQDRLNVVQLQLEEIRGQLRYLDDQSSFATITFDVAERGAPAAKPAEKKDDGWGFRDAWNAAGSGFQSVIGGLFVALVTAGPILVALLIAAFAVRGYLRRRRPVAPPPPASPAELPSS
jgi:hypothetical protein